MTTARERLVQWLRDAHAMEEQAETMLKGHLDRVKHYPQFEARVGEHLRETRDQQTLCAAVLNLSGKIRLRSRMPVQSFLRRGRPSAACSLMMRS